MYPRSNCLLGITWSAILLVAMTFAAPATAEPASGNLPGAAASPVQTSLTSTGHPPGGSPADGPDAFGPVANVGVRRSGSRPVTLAERKPDGDVPTWPFVVGTIAAVAAAALWAVRRRP